MYFVTVFFFFIENLLLGKTVGSQISTPSKSKFLFGLTEELSLEKNFWFFIDLVDYYKIFGFDILPVNCCLSLYKNIKISMGDFNPLNSNYNENDIKFCCLLNGITQLNVYFTCLCKNGGSDGRYVLISTISNITVIIEDIRSFGLFLRKSSNYTNDLKFLQSDFNIYSFKR